MKVTREKTEDCQAFLTIEMEAAEIAESLEASYHRLAQRTNIPGFRKGKAPRSVLERHIGKENALEDAINHLVPEACEKAIKEQDIKAIAQPRIEITQKEPVIFNAVVPLPPTIKLGDYPQIRMKPEPVEITNDNVNAVLEELRHQNATWEPVERPLDFNDMAVMDVESDVEEKPFINQKGVQYRITHDSPTPLLGFAEQLVGMNKGEEKEFKLKIPADFYNSELAEKEASFRVKIIETKQENLPELNDELAKQVSPDFETLDSLREQTSTNLKLRAEEKSRVDFEERVIDAAVDLAQVEFPPIMVEAETERLLSEWSRRLQMDDKGLERYLASANKTEEQLREEMRPTAVKRVTHALVLGKIVEEEKIEANDSDIDTEIEKMVNSASENKDKLKNFLDTPQSRQSIKQTLITRKTIERLLEIAGGTEKAKPKDKEEKNE